MNERVALLVIVAACGGAPKRDLTKYAPADRALLEKAHFNCYEPSGTDGELAYLTVLDKKVKESTGEIVKVWRDDTNIEDDWTITLPAFDQSYQYAVEVLTGAGGGAKAIITNVVLLGTGDKVVEDHPGQYERISVSIPPNTKETDYKLRLSFEEADPPWSCIEYQILRSLKTKPAEITP